MVRPAIRVSARREGQVPATVRRRSSLLAFSRVSVDTVEDSIVLEGQVKFQRINGCYVSFGHVVGGYVTRAYVCARLLYGLAGIRIRVVALFQVRVQVALQSALQISIVRVQVRVPSPQALSARVMSWAWL